MFHNETLVIQIQADKLTKWRIYKDFMLIWAIANHWCTGCFSISVNLRHLNSDNYLRQCCRNSFSLCKTNWTHILISPVQDLSKDSSLKPSLNILYLHNLG